MKRLTFFDLVLFLRSCLTDAAALRWWPDTLLYAARHSGALEVFARSRSRAYFDRVKLLLGVGSKNQLQPILDGFAANPSLVPRWPFESFSPAALIGFNELATRP
jgi:hypothetical protein